MTDSPKPKRLVLIDGHAVLFRAFHAMPEFTSPSGEATGAVYGFVNVMIRVVRELVPTWIVACFDTVGPTFRNIAYTEYKATRAETPPSLIHQEPLVHEALAALAIPSYGLTGYEADDLIATFVEQALHGQKPEVEEVVIVTGDRDLLQLAEPRVLFYLLRRGIKDIELLTPPAVETLLGLPVDHYLDWKALRGDPSDNIPGVPGIGDKTAMSLITQFGTLDRLFAALKHNATAAPLSPRLQTALLAAEASVRLFRTLLELKADVPLKLDLLAATRAGYDPDRARTLLAQYGFRTILDRLPQASTAAIQGKLL
ncbi:hypothetical protein HY523_01750 [Candidatus Berkelbacteria bacterium]|nr:hypothetical protein [Candidatus Berkelbacteria bacterium]